MNPKEIEAAIAEKAEALLPELEDDSVFLVGVRAGAGKKNFQLTVSLDGDKGVNIEQCAALSRKLDAWIEETGLLEGGYRIEVSSPGVDEPLKLPRQWKANVGRRLKVSLKAAEGAAPEQVEGELKAIEGQAVTLAAEIGKAKKGQRPKTEDRTLTFDEIEKAVVQVAFR